MGATCLSAQFDLPDRIDGLDFVHMSAQRCVVLASECEFDGRDQGGRRHVPEGLGRHVEHIDHHRDAAAGPHVGFRPAARDMRQRVFHRFRQAHRVFSDARAQAAPSACHEENRANRRFTVLGDDIATACQRGRHVARFRL